MAGLGGKRPMELRGELLAPSPLTYERSNTKGGNGWRRGIDSNGGELKRIPRMPT